MERFPLVVYIVGQEENPGVRAEYIGTFFRFQKALITNGLPEDRIHVVNGQFKSEEEGLSERNLPRDPEDPFKGESWPKGRSHFCTSWPGSPLKRCRWEMQQILQQHSVEIDTPILLVYDGHGSSEPAIVVEGTSITPGEVLSWFSDVGRAGNPCLAIMNQCHSGAMGAALQEMAQTSSWNFAFAASTTTLPTRDKDGLPSGAKFLKCLSSALLVLQDRPPAGKAQLSCLQRLWDAEVSAIYRDDTGGLQAGFGAANVEAWQWRLSDFGLQRGCAAVRAQVAPSERLVVLCDLTGTLFHRNYLTPVEGVPESVHDRAWYIYERPYAQEMVRELAEHPMVSIGIFTTMTDKNAKTFLRILGLMDYFFFVYAQNEDMGWCEEDHENFNHDKQRYEWKKNLHNVFGHASTELGFNVGERNCIVVDDTPRKTREYPNNVIVPARYDEAAVRGPDHHLCSLMRYLIRVAENFHGDIQTYMRRNPFEDCMDFQPCMPLLAPQPGSPAGAPLKTLGGSLCGAALQRLCDSNFKMFYDKTADSDFDAELVQEHLRAWLGQRAVSNTASVISKVTDVESVLRLWSSETCVRRRVHGVTSEMRFYRFINSELQRDDQKPMVHVAALVRHFNSKLVQAFRPPQTFAYRGTQLPPRKTREFFEQVLTRDSELAGFFRIPSFFAVSLSRGVADDFARQATLNVIGAGDSTGGGKPVSGGKGFGGGSGGKGSSGRGVGGKGSGCKAYGKGFGKGASSTPALQPVIFEVQLPEHLQHARLLNEGESVFACEREVLFPPYSLFKFTGLLASEAVWHVHIEAMADNKHEGKLLEKAPCLFWC